MSKLPTPLPLPTQPPLELLRDVALQVAGVAGIPAEECEEFCQRVCGSMQMVWERDRRVMPSKPGRALLKAADAARTLNEAFGSLNKVDREWVERLLALEPWSEGRLCRLPLTVWLLASLFSTATGASLPAAPGTAALRDKRGRIKGAVKDMMFEVFIHHILVHATDAGGELTFDKNAETGTLIDALNIFRLHLPRGLVPNALPLGTIQKIKTKHSKFQRRHLEILAKLRSPPLDHI
jgi:hypothetical protein